MLVEPLMRRAISLLTLTVYMPIGLGVSGGRVICLGEDGHVASETPGGCDREDGGSDEKAGVRTPEAPCVDLTLPPASSSYSREGAREPSSTLVAALPALIQRRDWMRDAPSSRPGAHLEDDDERAELKSLGTTRLLI